MYIRSGAIAAIGAASLFIGISAHAQDLLVDTGAGSDTQFPATSCFNNPPNFQYIGMQIVLGDATEIGRVDAWMTGFGSVNVKLYTNSGTNFPGTQLESATFGPLANNNTPSWRTFAGLDWSVAAGTYWITFEVDAGAGNHAFQPGVTSPLPKYAFLANGNPGWASLGGTTKLGLRVWTPTPPEPLLVPSQYPTIQAAIDNAVTGDIIEVAPGTYFEAIDFFDQSVELRSSGGPDVTIIDATGLNQPTIANLGPAPPIHIEGFTITGGSHLTNFAMGGGLFAHSSMTVENCVFTGNIAESGCGAAVLDGAEVTFINCVFDDNDNLAAFTSGGGAYVNDATAHFIDCTFTNNDIGNSGGALNVNVNGLATATNCAFMNNSSLNAGGAVTVINSTAVASFDGCTFRENIAVQAGGAMVNAADVDFIDCDFIENESTHNAIGGGGIQAQGAVVVVISGCDFIRNHTNHTGGGAQFISFTGTASIAASRFRDNEAVIAGGGFHVNGGGALSVSTTEFCGNTGGDTLGSFTDLGGNTFAAACTPDNDDPDDPELILAPGATQGTFEGATNSGTSSCEPDGVDLFYAFTIINGPIDILIDTCGSDADTALAVFDSDDVEIACATDCTTWCVSDAACIPLPGLANGDFLIRVSLEGGAVAGGALEFVLNFSEAELETPGDFNGDFVVDAQDAALFCGTLGSSTGDAEFIEAADFDENGTIDHLDQQTFNKILPACTGDTVTSATFAPPADGSVDAADLAYLLGAWGSQPSCADSVTSRTFAPPPDGKVDAADLAFLLGAWGPCP